MKEQLRALGARVAQIIGVFGLDDAFTFTGLACACYGIAQFSAPIAWMAGGAALFWLGVKK